MPTSRSHDDVLQRANAKSAPVARQHGLRAPTADRRALIPGHFVSAPLLELLRRATIAPEQVDSAIDAITKQWSYPLLRADHSLLVALRETTGVGIVTIARRHRRLLLEIDARQQGRRRWHYQELGRRETVLKCHASLPHALAAAVVGRTLSEVTSAVSVAGDATIAQATTHAGRLTLSLKTIWIAY